MLKNQIARMLYIYYVKEKNVLTSDDCKFYCCLTMINTPTLPTCRPLYMGVEILNELQYIFSTVYPLSFDTVQTTRKTVVLIIVKSSFPLKERERERALSSIVPII